VAPSCPAPDGAFTVGFAGTLKPWHGLETLAEAFGIAQQADPAFRLLIVGDGPRRSILEEALARAPHPERVIFTGALDPGRMPGMLASMDVAAAPYDDLPGFYFSPLKLFEYMACGRASVASAVGQIPEIIRHGATGLLCPPGDAGALAGALLRLRREPALRADIGNAARAYVTRNHTWDATARRVFEIAGSAAKGFA
jgi:glycosyltransferase involved in cell wall biosynthesis